MMIKVEPAQAMYLALQKRLDEAGKSESIGEVMMKAINETASWMKEETYNATKGMYTIKAGSFKKSDLKLEKAKKTRLRAVIKVTGHTLSLRKAYKSRKNTRKKAAQAMVRSGGAMKELEIKSGGRSYKAFLATMSSGHEGIFQRVPGSQMKNKPGREAIKEILAMAKSKAAEQAYMEKVDPDKNELYFRLHKHLNEVIGG